MRTRVQQIRPESESNSSTPLDVVVVGAGLAGKAASLQLARAGLKVTCISPAQATRSPVGESLDWSAPDLLNDLGLPMDYLIDCRMATWKRHVTLRMRNGCTENYVPSNRLAGPPLNIELRTLHLDRFRLDDELLKLTADAGVKLVPDKAVEVESTGKQIFAVRTASGEIYRAAWFIDASGIAGSLFARQFNLPKIEDGRTKVAIWSYFSATDPVQGTTLYVDPSPTEYLGWVWEIPVNPQTVGVGVVTSGESMKAKRDQGLTVDAIYREGLAKFPRFEPLLAARPVSRTDVTSFKCHVYRGVAGPNWLICGEAASMVDPITANGVTAALRHAAEASKLILKYRDKGKLPLLARACYSSRILHMARFFNSGIEKTVYEPPVRNVIGLQKAGKVYTTPAWSLNLVYARLKPFGVIRTLLLDCILGTFRISAWLFHQVSLMSADKRSQEPA